MSFLLAVPRLAWEILAVIVFFFAASWGKSCYDDKIIKEARANQQIDSLDVARGGQRDTLRLKDSTVVHDITRYHDVRTQVLESHPGDTSVQNLVQKCDQIIVSCADQRKASAALIHSDSVEIAKLKAMKKFNAPRFSVSALAGYDVLAKQPVVQLCPEFRMFGALSLVACGEAERRDPTPSDASRVETRAIVAGKITFR